MWESFKLNSKNWKGLRGEKQNIAILREEDWRSLEIELNS